MRRTHDEAPRARKRFQFYTVESISPKRHLTPEGFMLCEDVPLARTGEMLYGPGETPVSTAADGRAHVFRDAADLFRPETIASFNGKPLLMQHTDIDPTNWKDHAVGTILNPRRGTGDQADILLGDLMVTNADAIQAIDRDGLREISCGYDAEYAEEEDRPGYGRQYDIIGNHAALVDKGRCGPRCSIGDRRTVNDEENEDMRTYDEARGNRRVSTRDRLGAALDKLKAAFKTGDAAEFNSSLTEAEKQVGELPAKDEDMGGGGEGHHVHLHMAGEAGPAGSAITPAGDGGGEEAGGDVGLEARVGRLEQGMEKIISMLSAGQGEGGEGGEGGGGETDDEEMVEDEEGSGEGGTVHTSQVNTRGSALAGSLKMEAPPGTGDRAARAHDSVYLVDSFRDTVALAEIIVPGIRIPTMDRAAKPGKTFDAICKFRRTVLDLAYNKPETRSIMDEVLGGQPLDTRTMTCDSVRTVFRAVGAARKMANGTALRSGGYDQAGTGGGLGIASNRKITSLADLNKANDARYGGKK